MLEMPRRRFLIGAAALFCAPAIVRASSLMPVKPLPYGAPAAMTATEIATLAAEFKADLEKILANLLPRDPMRGPFAKTLNRMNELN